MTDTRDQNEEKKDEGHQDEDKERDDILGQLSEKEGQEIPRKKEPVEEPPKEEVTPQKSEPDTEDTEDIGSLIDKNITDEPQSEPVEEISAIQRVIGVFTSPQKVFQYLSAKPEFWVPIIITIIISIISLSFIFGIITTEIVEKIRLQGNMTQEQIENFEDLMVSINHGPAKYAIVLGFAILSTLSILIIPALIFWFVGNIILGGKTSFKHILSAFSYSYLIVSILGTIVKTPLILSKESLKVQTSLAAFLSQNSMDTTLYRLLANFDIFIIWMLIVFAIGFTMIYNFEKVKGFLAVFVPWLLYVLISSLV